MFLVLQEEYLHVLLYNETFSSTEQCSVCAAAFMFVHFKTVKILQGSNYARVKYSVVFCPLISSLDSIRLTAHSSLNIDVWLCSFDHILFSSSETNCFQLLS